MTMAPPKRHKPIELTRRCRSVREMTVAQHLTQHHFQLDTTDNPIAKPLTTTTFVARSAANNFISHCPTILRLL